MFSSKLATERSASEGSQYRAMPSSTYAPYLVYLTTRVADSRDLSELWYFTQILDPVFADALRSIQPNKRYLHFRDVRNSLQASRISILGGLNRAFMLTLLQECPEGFGWLTGSRGLVNHVDEEELRHSVDLVADIVGRYNFVLKQQLRLRGINIGSCNVYRPYFITELRDTYPGGGGGSGGSRPDGDDDDDDDGDDQQHGH